MIGENWFLTRDFLGIGAEHLTAWQMGIRAILIYLIAIGLVRLGEKRFLGKYSALDAILGFILGSILSRAVTGSSPFFETLIAGLVLVILHKAFSILSFNLDGFGNLVKGHKRELVREGEIQWDIMRKTHITEDDLHAAMRLQEQLDDVASVKLATLERSGEVSVIERKPEPQVVEVEVRKGVQVVRIEMH